MTASYACPRIMYVSQFRFYPIDPDKYLLDFRSGEIAGSGFIEVILLVTLMGIWQGGGGIR